MATLVIVAWSLTACAQFNHAQSNSPVALNAVPALTPAPRVALVLGSGGPRGYAHIGVMRVLEDAGIRVDLVVGSSVGSLLGAFWAHGYSAQALDRLSQTGGPLTVFDFSLWADRGWIHGQRLQDYVNQGLNDSNIEDLPRQFIAVATRMHDKQPVFFNSGNVGVAVRASSAVHRIFSPVGIQGVEYEDADESLPVAVRAARQAGAQFVIAVDVTAHAGSAPEGTSAARLAREARRRARIDPELQHADFVIHPDMGFATRPTTAFFQMARQSGESEAQRLLPQLKVALKKQQAH
jgi:NTE family protein